LSAAEIIQRHVAQTLQQHLQTFMPSPAMHCVPMIPGRILAHPAPQHATHQQAFFGHPPIPAAMSPVFDGRHGRHGMAQNDSSRDHTQQLSPTRHQTSPIKQQNSPTKYQGQRIKNEASSALADSDRMVCNSLDSASGGQVLRVPHFFVLASALLDDEFHSSTYSVSTCPVVAKGPG
jgi:hypothetical protein